METKNKEKLSIFYDLCEKLGVDYDKDTLFVKRVITNERNYDDGSFDDPWKLKDRFLYIG